MAEPSTHINYSFDDVQRYLQGKMSAAEMHAIEKAALQDPFLADAIDGYREADANTAKQHLNEINAALFAEKANTKIVGFNKKMKWLNVAALLIVLAGIGVVAAYFLRSSSNQHTEIAQVKKNDTNNLEQQKPAFEKLNTSPAFTDTVSFIAQNKTAKKPQASIPKSKEYEKIIVAEDQAVQQDGADKDKTETVSVLAAAPPLNLNTTDSFDYALTNNPPVEEKQMMARSYVVADTPARLKGKVSGLSVLPSPFVFSGKVMDKDSTPIPFAFIESDDKLDKTFTDVNGNFNLQKKDSLLNVTLNTVGFNNRSIALKQGINNLIVLDRAEMNLSDVAGTTAIKRKTRPDSAMPVGGWYNFNRYVLSELDEDSTTENNMSETDLVELEFLVDKAGNPYNIKVIKPLDGQHNSKAVEILKNGPKWTKPIRNKKARVIINF